MGNTCLLRLLTSGPRRCRADHLVWILEGQPSSGLLTPPNMFPLAPNCYLAFQWRPAVPPGGGHECGIHGRKMEDGWRTLLIHSSTPPPLSLFVSMMILLSCQRQHYHIPVAWETSTERDSHLNPQRRWKPVNMKGDPRNSEATEVPPHPPPPPSKSLPPDC